MNSFELEVGKTYINGLNEEITITHINRHELFVSSTDEWYMKDGTFSAIASEFDIVSEKLVTE
jgi:hypothetical protein